MTQRLRLGTGGAAAVAAALLAATRWPFAPRHLYYFDNINFALALERFDPSLHQPQPPGYPLFVGLTRLLHLAIPSVEAVFFAAGVLLAVAALLLTRALGERMFSPRAGWFAAWLLLFNPVFWLGGVTHQVRLSLAAGGMAVAYACWRARETGNARWFYAASGLLAAACGFRPAMIVYLTPLLLWTAWRGRFTLRQWAAATSLFGGIAGSWFAVTVWASGGFVAFWNLLQGYAQEQFHGSSLVYGAPPQAAGRMVEAAFVWTFLGVLSWIWALPWMERRGFADRGRAVFLAAAFLPAFLFHALIHVGDPDHTLITVPLVCLLGGRVLERARVNVLAAAAAAMALNVLLWLVPPPGLARAASARAVRAVDRITSATFDAIREQQRAGPVVLICYESRVTWRHLSYYFPEVPLYVLHAAEDAPAWLLRGRTMEEPEVRGGAYVLQAGATVLWVVEPPAAQSIDPPAEAAGPVFRSEAGSFSFRHYRFVRRQL